MSTVTFRNSPIHVLEKFTIRDVEGAYLQFKEHSGLDECVIIQTCNRIELFGKWIVCYVKHFS